MEHKTTTAQKIYPFEFHGKGGEFFKIWIVNILLTIITLGIYSAWAKVRTNRYFYGNTTLNNASFEYLASPLSILKGRIIAVVLFIVYTFITELNPIAGIVILVLFMLATPYIVVRAIRFQHRMTAYRNVRFDFTAGFGEAAMAYIVWPLLSMFTLGLLYPFVHQRFTQLYVSNSCYGEATFVSQASVGAFYKLYLILFTLIISFYAVILIAAMTMGIGLSDISALNIETPGIASSIILMFIAGISILFYFFAIAFIKARFTNLIVNNTVLDERCHFESTLSVSAILWLLSSNAVLIICTLGLAYPWTKVRLARYRAEHSQMMSHTSLDDFIGQRVGKTNSLSEEMGEIFDIDIGL
ncbi:MAG: YjgN family protein [Mariprofundaceae bacterium]|nr:YjgN family protein [Mariprofundaceae bacterium]